MGSMTAIQARRKPSRYAPPVTQEEFSKGKVDDEKACEYDDKSERNCCQLGVANRMSDKSPWL